MSFVDSSELKENDAFAQIRTCCTVAVTYLGEYAGSFTECMPGAGPSQNAQTCALATAAAAAYVKKKNAEITDN